MITSAGSTSPDHRASRQRDKEPGRSSVEIATEIFVTAALASNAARAHERFLHADTDPAALTWFASLHLRCIRLSYRASYAAMEHPQLRFAQAQARAEVANEYRLSGFARS